MKICRCCKESKDLNLFVKNKAFSSGIDTICLDCSRQRVKEWRQRGNRKQGKRRQSSNSYRAIIIDFLIKRDGFVCGFCKKSLEDSKIHLDHIIPVALGGQDVMENIQLAHPSCNMEESLHIRKQSHGF